MKRRDSKKKNIKRKRSSFNYSKKNKFQRQNSKKNDDILFSDLPEFVRVEESFPELQRPNGKVVTTTNTTTQNKEYEEEGELQPPGNLLFEKYYKELIPEDEWDLFYSTMNRPLPVTIVLNLPYNDLNQNFLPILQSNIPGDLLESIKWYPQPNMAWKVNKTANGLTKHYPKVAEFIKAADGIGAIYRQEEVSMIPVCLLNVQPNQVVLDLCASPGSKTRQILQHIDQGVVIANDADQKRCFLLADISHPALIVTQHEGQRFPSEFLRYTTQKLHSIQYDSILCDVPCSGDGTFRKKDRTKKLAGWGGNLAINVHSLQISLLKRAIELVKVRGRVVYSTCSMNPIENEAVVAEILRMFPNVQLVDVSKEIPNLNRRKGLTTWKVMSAKGDILENYEQASPEDLVEPETNPDEVKTTKKKFLPPGAIKKSMFPPDQKEVKTFNLGRCIRIHPHLNDSGGFFVAVFQKIKAGPTPPVHQRTKTEKNFEVKNYPIDQMFVPIPRGVDQGINQFFKTSLGTAASKFKIFARNDSVTQEKVSKVYLLTDKAADIIKIESRSMRVVTTGVPAFGRWNENFSQQNNFGPTVEILPYLPKIATIPTISAGRYLAFTKENAKELLTKKLVLFKSLSEKQRLTIESLKEGVFVVVAPLKNISVLLLCRYNQGQLILCGNKEEQWYTKTIFNYYYAL